MLLMLLAFGCKEESEQAGGLEQTREVDTNQMKKEIGVEEQENQLVVDLHEVSVFDLSDEGYEVSPYFVRGQMTFCDAERARVWPGTYPRFESREPLRGSITFGGKPAAHSPPRTYYLAIDESGGTGTGYDRLYFDRNGDRDLTNDKPLMALKDPPRVALLPYSSTELQVCFESFKLTFDFGSAGRQPVEIMTRLIAHERNPRLTFFATKVRKGAIEIGDAKYDALLGHAYSIGIPLDQRGTVFHLVPKRDPQDRPRWSGADQLRSTHAIGGQYYRFATTPLGDKLFGRPYDGPLGTFEVGPGGRDIQEVSIQGSLLSEETAVAVGDDGMEDGWPKPAKSCRVPVGDYRPVFLRLTFGRLSITISGNYHADGKPRGGGSRPDVYGIRIRQDKPYIFDLTNKPDVLFASPAKDKRVKLGNELRVKAVLVDPELDVMVRGLDDMTHVENTTVKMADGQERTFKRARSLDPKVVITRADGEKVAEGVMPFG
ncbi:MAG: hypothetical protein JSW66_04530 [Phycisphaerales bacterium]|nr:MAG: hypothetical protein JSW66_04530 [Phycisphaerales bacterium]